MFLGVFQQVAARRIVSCTIFRAQYHWRRFHIDEDGHGDWDATTSEREPRTVQVRFSCVPESIMDALHGLRAIERQFGRIRDYRLLRDSEIPSNYQAICWATFESPGSLLRVPPQGTKLKVALPPPLGRPEGGPGLDDIRSLLVPETRGNFNTSNIPDPPPKSVRVVTVTVKRAGAEITFRSTVQPPHRSRAMKAAIGHGFLEWSGFSPLKPLYESSPFTSPAQDPPPLDSKNMRIALNKWSQILGVSDPLFPEMKHPVVEVDAEVTRRLSDPDNNWEPLSQPLRVPYTEDNAIEEPLMPGGIQGSLRQSLESLLERSQAHVVTESTEDSTDDSPTQEGRT